MLRCLTIVSSLITVTTALECGRVPIEDALEPRVIGGHAPAEGNWPFVVHVMTKLVRKSENSPAIYGECTASIVGRRHVLTAAHCTFNQINGEDLNTSDFRVFIGSVWLKDQIMLSVSNVFTGPQWYKRRLGYGRIDDVAILELDAPIEFDDYAQPICLPKSFRERPGDPGYFVGFGTQNNVPEPRNDTTDYDEDIAVANENIVTFRKWSHCRSPRDDPAVPHREDLICAGQFMRLAHQGDSGGPLMVNRKGIWFQVGTDSVGWKRDGMGYGKFARVTSYCKWFKEVTNGEVTCVKI